MNENTQPKSIDEKELEVLKMWQQENIFSRTVETPANQKPKGQFSFYDGPPFATGMPHHGHILAGTVKDTIPRYQTMKGNTVRRVWGWDCHGLPIENLIEKKLGLESKKDIEAFGVEKFNRDAFNSVLQYEEEWKQVIPRLGRFVDMEQSYKTMDATYTESIWWAWKQLMEKGLAYEGYKMMHICPRCETPLAQSEVGLEYHDVTDLSVTAKFELVDEPGTYVLAWTTTPWTLPGNTALAVHRDMVYAKFEIEGMPGKYISSFASTLSGEIFKNLSIFNKETFTGAELIGKSYKPVFPYFTDKDIEHKENIWKIWHADFITLDTGTGIAHEAPAFGAEDMELAKLHNIPVIKHVNMDGTFVAAVTDFAGMKVKVKDDTQSADIEIIKYLAHAGHLFEKHKIIHSYPLCWRCKTPLLNYATGSWFVDVPKMKETLLAENKEIGWTPEHIRDGRFGKWLEGAREWAVSRSRYWGAPLPVWKNKDGTEMKVVGSLKELAEGKLPRNTYYVMRHGQARSNVEGILEIGDDVTNELTDSGRTHIEEQAHALRDAKIDMIIASPVLRSEQTAEIVSRILGGVPVVCDERLRENNIGVFNGQKIEDYIKANGGTDFLRMKHRPEGGETHEEIQNRMMSVLSDCEKEHVGKTILFISHGGPLRMLIAGAALKTEEEIIADEEQEHTQMYLKNGEFQKLDEVYIVPRDESGAVNLHRPYIDEVTFTDSQGQTMTRIVDVFDCWFESGSMPFASIHYPFENKAVFDATYPADFIAEGLDQTRGWFYSLINLGVGLFGKAPYKHVIVNGLVMAESGSKLSKSEKNYTDPMELVSRYGADALRYFLLSSPAMKGENVVFSDKGVEDVYKKVIQRLENVMSLYEMNKTGAPVLTTSGNVLDVWVMSRLHQLISEATRGYDAYLLDEAVRGIDQFVDDVSVWYVRRSRDRLKGAGQETDTLQAEGTLRYVLLTCAKVLAPAMPFIAERMYKTAGGDQASVHLETWPTAKPPNEESLRYMVTIREMVSEALMLRNNLKINVRQPLGSLTFRSLEEIPENYLALVKEEVNVKNIIRDQLAEKDIVLDTVITEDLRIEGDIRNLIRAVQDARKDAALDAKEKVTLFIPLDTTEKMFTKALSKESFMKTCGLADIQDFKFLNGVIAVGGVKTFNLSGESVAFGLGDL